MNYNRNVSESVPALEAIRNELQKIHTEVTVR